LKPAETRSAPAAPYASVLVVEDEPSNRDMLSRFLTKRGYEVRVAVDGETALGLIERQAPDVVLLDVQLPGIDGFEVCGRIKERQATRLIPVVLVTGLDAREHKIQGIRAGADDFLGKPYDFEELIARVRSLVQLKRYTDELESAESVILSLALTIEARDAYTEGHCQRLAAYAEALGAKLNLGPDELAALNRGGFLHDVGKVGIPDYILLKEGSLTGAEYEAIKQHTIIGDRLCGELRSLRLVRQIVRHHHERLDGSGYPDGLRGNEVPVLAQIVSIADTYDAITTSRPYRPARAPEIAYEELLREVASGARRRDFVEAFIELGRSGELARLAVRV